MYIKTEYIWYTTPTYLYSTGLELFWDDFPKTIPSETWTHPPTSIVISDFFICTAPKHIFIYIEAMTLCISCPLGQDIFSIRMYLTVMLLGLYYVIRSV